MGSVQSVSLQTECSLHIENELYCHLYIPVILHKTQTAHTNINDNHSQYYTCAETVFNLIVNCMNSPYLVTL